MAKQGSAADCWGKARLAEPRALATELPSERAVMDRQWLTAGRAQTAGTTGAVAQGSATAAVTRARSWLARGRCRWQWRLG